MTATQPASEQFINPWNAQGTCSYVAASDLRELIAEGLRSSCFQNGYWHIDNEFSEPTTEDTRWLREAFLDVVERALMADRREMLPGSLGRNLYETPDIYADFAISDLDFWCQWWFDGRDSDGAWCFTLSGPGMDDESIWLRHRADGDRRSRRRIIDDARRLIRSL